MCSGDGWLEQGANLILFGPPGGRKSHLAAAIGLALIEIGWRVLRWCRKFGQGAKLIPT